ncbi:MAG: ABC transporter permease, partial [Oscillospiraceae bacterium]|nr:ABC transporter permease [Oscillospiraceae bacterium]
MKIYEIYYYLHGGMSQTDYNETAQRALHTLYGGEITDEKIAALKADLDKANDAFNKYGYTEEPIDGTYSGYPSIDTILLSFKIEDYRYAILYANTSNRIKEDALRNVEFYTGKNDYDKRENELIAKLYGGRTIGDCLQQSGWDAFFDYKFSVLLCMFLIALTVSPMVSNERESGFYRIIISSGRRKSVLGAKIFSAGI